VKFSAILLSWQRPANIPLVVESIRSFNGVDEVIVWNNNGAEPLTVHGATVINAPRNFGCFARFTAATLAKHENLWFQDDDLILTPDQFDLIRAAYAFDKERLYGAFGRRLRSGQYVAEDCSGEVDIILGRTTMCHKALLHHAFEMPAAVATPREDDIHFSLQNRRKHFALDVGPINDLGLLDTKGASLQPNHLESRQAAVDTCFRYFGQESFHTADEQIRFWLSNAAGMEERVRLRHEVALDKERMAVLESNLQAAQRENESTHTRIADLQEQLSSRTVKQAQALVRGVRRAVQLVSRPR
jgi:hypothetical protein